MEPNLGFIKTSWLPIVASEKLELDYGEILNKVYVYNYPEHKTAHDMISDFKVKNKLLKLKEPNLALRPLKPSKQKKKDKRHQQPQE